MQFNGKVLAILDGAEIVACATLRSVSSKTVTSVVNSQGIKGSFSFSQKSPFDVTMTTVNVTGLDVSSQSNISVSMATLLHSVIVDKCH